MINAPKFTRLTLEQPERKIIVEYPLTDVDGMEMVEALRTIMLGMGFPLQTVLNCMASLVNEQGSGLSEVRDHNNQRVNDEEDI